MGFLHKVQNFLPRSALIITMYKAFVRLQLDYGDIINDETYNAYFNQKLDLFQHSDCLAIVRATTCTSK